MSCALSNILTAADGKPLHGQTVTLECRNCNRKPKRVPFDPAQDPPGTVRVVDYCPRCVEGGFSDPSYYDKDGNELFQS